MAERAPRRALRWKREGGCGGKRRDVDIDVDSGARGVRGEPGRAQRGRAGAQEVVQQAVGQRLPASDPRRRARTRTSARCDGAASKSVTAGDTVSGAGRAQVAEKVSAVLRLSWGGAVMSRRSRIQTYHRLHMRRRSARRRVPRMETTRRGGPVRVGDAVLARRQVSTTASARPSGPLCPL